MMWNESVLEPPTVPVSGESRYMTRLWVSANVEETGQSDSSQSVPIGSELQADSLYHKEITYKIRDALKLLSLREKHVIVQFWSPRDVGKHQLLTTIDQPFGVGVANEKLCFYRRDSERNTFLVNKDHEEKEGRSPPARVFNKRLPEWTSDVTNYKTKDFPQQDSAIRCNLHGYLALPVIDPTTGLCVGVLELLTSSKFEDFAYEVEHIHQELKIWNLTSPQLLVDGPASNVLNERSINDLDKIYGILKFVCDTHNLPLAQTWTLSPYASCVAHEKVLKNTCNSYNIRCLGKVCMSTALPCYVRDLSTWLFMDACKERHLEMSHGVAGRALSSRGSCFCGDVTKLDKEEYPLVHNAHQSGLAASFAIYLHSVECDDDYVLEFFLSMDFKENRHVQNLVQTLKNSVKAASGFELGDGSSMEVVGPPADLFVSKTSSSDSESIVADAFEPDYENVADEWPSINDSTGEMAVDYANDSILVIVNVTFNKSMEHFTFPLFLGLSKLKNEVVRRFKLDGQRLRLKYMDEDDDLILISLDDDLKSALDASGSIKLICLDG